MTIHRFSLNSSDRAYSAIDGITAFMGREIRGLLREIQEDPAALGELTAYLHVLACIGEGTNGYARVSDLDLGEVREAIMACHRQSVSEEPEMSADEIEDETKFIDGIFDRLQVLER